MNQLMRWRSGDGEAAWLSTLIDAMETVSRHDVRATPCDGRLLSALRAQLAQPASPRVAGALRFSRRN
jgi:hypothetical protein